MYRQTIRKLLSMPFYRWERFHASTKFKRWTPLPDQFPVPESWSKVFFKEYPRLEKIILPKTKKPSFQLIDALLKRKSHRLFSHDPVSIDEISTLLSLSAGMHSHQPPFVANRTYPSGGARYPLEMYILSLNSDLPKGIYHYNVKEHYLEILMQQNDLSIDTLFNQEWIKDASLLIIISAVFERNTVKYGDRGYRHVLQESGHLGQNLYLVSTSLNLAISGIGAYLDDRLHELLDIDGVSESIVYILGVGKKDEKKAN